MRYETVIRGMTKHAYHFKDITHPDNAAVNAAVLGTVGAIGAGSAAHLLACLLKLNNSPISTLFTGAAIGAGGAAGVVGGYNGTDKYMSLSDSLMGLMAGVNPPKGYRYWTGE